MAKHSPQLSMSASAYRYQAQPDRNVALRRRIVELAQRHKRYGVGMIHLKLRQEGDKPVNYKRVERLYREERLQVRRRKRKKIPVSERQPLFRPSAPNEVWSMDFVFDRTADARVLKCLTIVDDATHESVGIEVERALSGTGVTRACPGRFAPTTEESSAARRWSPGRTRAACSCA
jgi:transposase InsO family protein